MLGVCKMIYNVAITLAVSALAIFACDGDCIKCHPALIKSGHLDKNHEILSTCIKCHKVTSDDLQRMGAICGQDCWQCHDVKKVMKIPNKAHLSLNRCIDCHTKLDKKDDMFSGYKEFSFPQQNNSLQNRLQKWQ